MCPVLELKTDKKPVLLFKGQFFQNSRVTWLVNVINWKIHLNSINWINEWVPNTYYMSFSHVNLVLSQTDKPYVIKSNDKNLWFELRLTQCFDFSAKISFVSYIRLIWLLYYYRDCYTLYSVQYIVYFLFVHWNLADMFKVWRLNILNLLECLWIWTKFQ